jgi:hypothetical protein
MGRWFRVLLGPLPATILLLPVLVAGGLGAAIALVTALVQPARSAAERWASVTAPGLVVAWVAAAGVGVAALWIAVLADTPATLRQGLIRWWLVAGLGLGFLAAGRWLWVIGSSGHSYDRLTWGLWLTLLIGPVVFGLYYLVQLVRGGAGVTSPANTADRP